MPNNVLWATLTSRMKGESYLLILLLVCSVTINVFLARKVYQTREAAYRLWSERQLIPGSAVPPLEGTTADGKQLTFNYGVSERPLLIYEFSPSCSWCVRNQQSVEALTAAIENKYRIVGVSLSAEGLDEYLKKHHFVFPILAQLSEKCLPAYKLGGTPRTVVVSPDGKVVKNWSGAYMEDVKDEVEKYFGVGLPLVTQAEIGRDGTHEQ